MMMPPSFAGMLAGAGQQGQQGMGSGMGMGLPPQQPPQQPHWMGQRPMLGQMPQQGQGPMPFRPQGQAGPSPPGGGNYERMLMAAMQPKPGLAGVFQGLGNRAGGRPQQPNMDLMKQLAQMQQMDRQRQQLAQQYGQSPVQWSQQPGNEPQRGGMYQGPAFTSSNAPSFAMFTKPDGQ